MGRDGKSMFDNLCNSCRLPDCVDVLDRRCPINIARRRRRAEHERLRMKRLRLDHAIRTLADRNRMEMHQTPAPIRSAAWTD